MSLSFRNRPSAPPTALVGAFERHNFGDWLMGWTFSRLLASSTSAWVAVTPAAADAPTPHRLVDLRELASAPDVGANPVVHVGGETLTCRMDVAMAITDPSQIWSVESAGEVLGLDRAAAYVTPAKEVVAGRDVTWGPRFFYGVGGTDLPAQPASFVDGVLAQLDEARWLGVRDETTYESLRAHGVAARLVPDVVGLYPSLRTNRRAEATPYVLVQCADALSSDGLAAALARSLGQREVVVCVAGIAGHHDSPSGAAGLVAALRSHGARARLVDELSPHRIAEWIGGAELVISSSLHVQILAAAYGRPHVSFAAPKTAIYAATWEPWQLHAATPDADAIVELVGRADAVTEKSLLDHAARMATRTRAAVTEMLVALDQTARDPFRRLPRRQRRSLAELDRRDELDLATLPRRAGHEHQLPPASPAAATSEGRSAATAESVGE